MGDLIDIQAIGQYTVTIGGAALSYWLGTKKRRNDFLQELQGSIDLLSTKNAELLKELVVVKKQNLELMISIDKVVLENDSLSKQILELKTQLSKLRQ